jgi:carboxypeptidase C (cathepsin A)
VLKQAEQFASGEFNQALLLGTGMDKDKRAAMVKKYARFTGLSETYVDRANLRVPLSQFAAELLRNEDLVLGRFDSRYTLFVRSALSLHAERDPSADAVFSTFASTFNDYVRNDLKFEEDRPYHVLAGVGPWNWGVQNEFADVSETLADAMTANPFLKVHVSCGFFDMATPYFAAQYQFHHLQLHPALAEHITMDYYTAGHMMYLNLPDLQKQNADLAKFIHSALAQ